MLFWRWFTLLLARVTVFTLAATSLSVIYEKGWGCVKKEKSQKSSNIQFCTSIIFNFQIFEKQIN